MGTSSQKRSGAQVALPMPVGRALRGLGQDISTARRLRRLSQEDLAQRIGTSLSTVRRMEDGYPGTALHTFLRALHVLGRLEGMVKVMAVENDALGMELVREQLPQRVRTVRVGTARSSRVDAAENDGSAAPDTDELVGF